jgi:cobalt/nickel transport system permease protein
MGMTGAFLFAAQMINFPVAPGVSGHLMGGFLAAWMLGPAAAMVVMSCVLAVQCFVFQDGGVTALGANLLNMGLMGSLGGYGIHALLDRLRLPSSLSIAVAAWCSVVLGSAMVALELALSGLTTLGAIMAPILAVHCLIGLGEALITVAAARVVLRTRPDWVSGSRP